jgi:hypothetical protein
LSQEGYPSPLLDRIWADLRQQAADSSWIRREVLKAVRAAAVYQPDQAFEFAQAASELGLERWEHDEMAEIVRVAAYHPRYTTNAFDELWSRAITDERPPNAYPSHAARLLTELVGYAPSKSVEFSQRILELARPRMREAGAFSRRFTPLDLADAVLEREAEIHEGTETGITLRAAALNHKVVQPLRSRAIDMVREALFLNEPPAQMRAVKSVSTILHGFSPAFGRRQSDEELKWQDDERLQMLDIVDERLRTSPSTALRFALLRTLESSVAPGGGAVDVRTRGILGRYHLGTDGLLLSAFCVPFWDERTVRHHEEQVRVNQERLTAAHGLFKERVQACAGPIQVFEELVATASEFGLLEGTAASTFVLRLCEDGEFLAALTQRAFLEPNASSTPFLSAAIRKMAAAGLDEFRQVAKAALESGHERLFSAAAHALVGMPFDRPTAADVELLWLAALGKGSSYRRAAFYSIGRMAEASPDLREATIGRLVTIDVPDSKTADDVCAAVAHVLPSLTREHAARLLERLVAPSRLDEHWIGEVLEWCSNMHSDLVVTFLLARFAEEGRRKGGGDYGYVARPDHLRKHDFTGIRNAPTYATAIREIRDALLNPAVSSSSAVELFWRMGQLDIETLSALDEWLHSDPSRLRALAPLIRDCHDPIALERPIFALHACQIAATVGSDAVERIASAFVGNAMPNEWSHAPGTVPPAFTEIAERARRIHEMLGSVPNSDVLKRIEDEAVRRGRLAAEDY